MKKINIIVITVFAIVGALVIYKFTNTPENKISSINNISHEYSMLEDNNVFKSSSIDEIANILNNGTGIVYFCIPENEWCQYYTKYLNDVAVQNNIDKIYYLNIKQDRKYNSNGYRKVLNILKDYLYKDDEGNKKIFVPTTIFVKKGVITSFDNETSTISNISPTSYYDDNKINEFNNRFTNYLLNYKEEL